MTSSEFNSNNACGATTVECMGESPGMISLRLAMSLDGYIADEEGGYDWMVPMASPVLDATHQLVFDEFLDDVDLLGKKVIVASSTRSGAGQTGSEVDFVGNDVVDVVRAARDEGEHCFLFGGGLLVESFLADDAGDRFTVGIVPVLLGGGRPLFPGKHPTLELRLTDYAVQQGKVRLVYERR